MLAKLLYTAGALSIGIGFAFQSAINAALARGLGSSLLAATISFCVGFIALAVFALTNGSLGAAAGSLRNVPLWMWTTGGLLGCGIVYGSIFLVPRIGVAAVAAFIIAGQLTAAAVIDHLGWFGAPVYEMNLMRAVGIVLLLSGALLVRLA